MANCYAYGVKIMSDPQGDICGNYVELQAGVAEDTVGPQPINSVTRNARPSTIKACEVLRREAGRHSCEGGSSGEPARDVNYICDTNILCFPLFCFFLLETFMSDRC